MRLELKWGDKMLQIALFPERLDYYRGIEVFQCKATQSDIEALHIFLQKALEDIYDCYEGWDMTDTEDRQEVFKRGLWTTMTQVGWAVLTHRHRVISLYMGGQALTLNAQDLGKLIVELEKIK